MRWQACQVELIQYQRAQEMCGVANADYSRMNLHGIEGILKNNRLL